MKLITVLLKTYFYVLHKKRRHKFIAMLTKSACLASRCQWNLQDIRRVVPQFSCLAMYIDRARSGADQGGGGELGS